jgi:hypothetical protein
VIGRGAGRAGKERLADELQPGTPKGQPAHLSPASTRYEACIYSLFLLRKRLQDGGHECLDYTVSAAVEITLLVRQSGVLVNHTIPCCGFGSLEL